jgi:cytochrome P450
VKEERGVLTLPSQSLLDDVSALFDLRPKLIADPYPLYHRMRAEAPVLVHRGVATLTRYDHIETVIRDIAGYSSRKAVGTRVEAVMRNLGSDDRAKLQHELDFVDRWVTQLDPPDHTRVRGLAHKAFTPRRVSAMEGQIAAIVDDLLDRAEAKPVVDLMEDLCFDLPVLVIGSMLGAAPEDNGELRRWSVAEADFSQSQANVDQIHVSRQEFRAYIRRLIEARRHTRHTDLLAALLAAEEAGDRLSVDELEGMFVLLLFAGHETTTNLIGHAVRALLLHPEQWSKVLADRELVSAAVEESLRWDTSSQMIHRVAIQDGEIGGVPIPRGQTVRLVLGAANRDPERYPDPDRFDVERADIRHLGFGIGPHYCLGQALARLEVRIALKALVDRYPALSLAGESRYRVNMQLRGLERLPVRLR